MSKSSQLYVVLDIGNKLLCSLVLCIMLLLTSGIGAKLYSQSSGIKIASVGYDNIKFSTNNELEAETALITKDGQLLSSQKVVTHQDIVFEDLLSSTIYNIEIRNKQDQIVDHFPIITKSLSSGEIRIYFNRNTDESFSNGSTADGETASAMEEAIIEMIDNAQYTLSICAYNTNRENVVNALRRAHNRGVEVRLIADIDNNNTGLQSNIPFPVLYGSVGDGIMHNKFIITDAAYDNLAWVQTGSVNYTDFQMEIDPNNAIFIQDMSLAQVYLTEFNEMWGGPGAMPVTNNAKFGQDKKDNTPHLLNINGIEVQSYFSPSDNTDAFIIDRIDAAAEKIDVALLIITRWELRDALIAAHKRGVIVRVLVEDQENSQDVLDRFEQAGLTTYYIDNNNTLLHHKYAIIDEGSIVSQAYLVTGSQNWTYSGNTFNDENTLIFKDDDIANIFKQEFQNLWQDTATSVLDEDNSPIDVSVKVIQNKIHIRSSVDAKKIFISSMNGQYVSIISSDEKPIDVGHLQSGVYVVTIKHGLGYYSTKVFIN